MCVCASTAAGLLWECVQCPQLTELDLKGCHLVELCDELQVRTYSARSEGGTIVLSEGGGERGDYCTGEVG